MANETQIKQTITEVPKQAVPPPEKPASQEETRLYPVNIKGKNKDGKDVISGTQKKWLTKAEAKKEGHTNWAETKKTK